MHDDTLTFQVATHYLPKIALYLERLCQVIEISCSENHPIIHHNALKNVLDILKLIEKPELKSRFLKELMRIEHTLNKLNTSLTQDLTESLYNHIMVLSHATGRFGEALHTDAFLQSLRLSQSIYGKEQEEHSIQLLVWLDAAADRRKSDIQRWFTNLKQLHSTISLYLSLLRSTGNFNKIKLQKGFYQCALPFKGTCHLIMLRVMKSFDFIPKIQIGHYGVSVRLCELHSMCELNKSSMDAELSICRL